MHDLLGPTWLFYGAIAAYILAPYIAAIGVAVVAYYVWRALKKRKMKEKKE